MKEKAEKKTEENKFYEKRVLLFGIPLEFSEKDIVKALDKMNLSAVKTEWETYKSMEYLAVNFKN